MFCGILLSLFAFVSQLMEVTGKTQDECMVALHDCNGDVNRAINFLLEEVIDKVLDPVLRVWDSVVESFLE